MGKVKKKVKKRNSRRSSVNSTKPITKKELAEFAKNVDPKFSSGYEDVLDNLYLGKGQPKAFESPQALMIAAKEYFTWCKAHPWYKNEYKDHKLVKIPTDRPFTWGGLCIRTGVSERYFATFKSLLKKEDEDYLTVISAIDSVIRTQKFEGAAMGFFNGNLIAYDLGLKKDVPMIMGGATALNINVAVESQSKLLDEVRSALEAIDMEHEEVKEETKQLNGNGKSNGKH